MEPSFLSPPASPSRRRRRREISSRKVNKAEIAVLVSVVASAIVMVQRFLMDHHLLLLPSHSMALEASFRATTLALSKLQLMFSLSKAVSVLTSKEDDDVHKTMQAKPYGRKSWFEGCLSAAGDDTEWRHNFRMSRAVFCDLLQILRPALQRQDTNMKDAIPAEWKLASALYRLAHGGTLKAVARKFDIGTSSCCKAFYEVCKALRDNLNHLFEFPSSKEGLDPIIQGFSSQGMPNCCGVIGCTQFLLEKPPSNTAVSSTVDYYDHNGTHSVMMQGVVDTAGRFLDISVGWGGSLSPGNILPRTRLFSRVEESSELLHGPAVELINKVLIPEYIIGDESYPLLPWLITPYQGMGLNPDQLSFNGLHDYVRGAVTGAFGTLKAQWQLLSMRQRVDNMKLFPFIVAAACILQNFLINSGEVIPHVEEATPRDPWILPERSEYAESIRDALAAHVTDMARMHLDLQ